MKHGSHADNDGLAIRDSWCTPKWIADAIGTWDLDPCSNERSHIRAMNTYRLDFGEDGLVRAPNISPHWRVFVNPPYSKGQVIRWIDAYKHAFFCFLLRFDPSTEWFRELYKNTALICVPRRRVNFEPPPGVQASSNDFPHAFFYARVEHATPAILRSCIAWRTGHGT